MQASRLPGPSSICGPRRLLPGGNVGPARPRLWPIRSVAVSVRCPWLGPGPEVYHASPGRMCPRVALQRLRLQGWGSAICNA
eukprot:974046-Pyramimonas_sp.AAC.1